MNATRGLCVGLLALACGGWTGCDDGGSDGDAEETAEEIAAEDTAVSEEETLPADEAPIALVAPTLIYPAAGRIFFMDDEDDEIKIRLDWTAVPGAASYVLELDGTQHAVAGTTVTLPVSDFGNHKWRVWAKDANGASGPASSKDSFSINVILLVPI